MATARRAWRAVASLSLAAASAACGGGTAPTDSTPSVTTPVATSIAISASVSSIMVGTTLPLSAIVRDQLGRPMSAMLTWSSEQPAVATVTADGTARGVSPGTATIRAASGAASGAFALAVTIPPAYVAGQSYLGRNGYIEYLAGNAPVILTAPHGGALAPGSIPNRTAASCGVAPTTVTDANTADLVRAMRAKFFARFGTYPHVIISHLARTKLDPNRVSPEADCGNAEAAAALEEWHGFINTAKSAVLQATGKGWYMDIHGHGHPIARLELGYLLSGSDLDRTDAVLDASPTFESTSSIRTLSLFSPLTFSALLRGPTSLGTLYANNGFPAIPSASDPRVGGTEYFNGGDNTVRHSCGAGATGLGGMTGGEICGVQLESNFSGVRDNAANRDRFGETTAVVLEEYLRVNWGIRLQP